jgi:predicted nucleic acid-binding protein
MLVKSDYVLDSTAILAVLLSESEGRRVSELLSKAALGETSIVVPFIALMESEYKLLRLFDRTEVRSSVSFLSEWPTEVVESTEEWRHEAARVKARGGLSLADAWIASLAVMLDAELVHKDSEFDSVPGLRSVRL